MTRWTASVLVLAATLLAGCGGQDENGGTQPTARPGPNVTSPAAIRAADAGGGKPGPNRIPGRTQ